MVSRKDDSIDFNKLEDEVHAAVDAEARYYRENDAKFRAINQKVATYDEFREIVMASHLKPLAKGDRLDGIKFIQPWNQAANKDNTAHIVQPPAGQNKISKKPTNGHEFARDWRRICTTNPDKYIFLLWLGPDVVRQIFKAEISFGLLGDIITALHEQYQPTHCQQVAAILKSLSHANRFKLSVDFLSKVEKDSCQKLFDKISIDLKDINAHNDDNVESDDTQEQGVRESVQPVTVDFDSEDLLSIRHSYGLGS